MVGPEQVNGRSAVARIAVGEGAEPRQRRVGWTERPYAEGADGVIGPGGLPQQVVRFVLRPAAARASAPSRCRWRTKAACSAAGAHSYALIDLGGAPLRVRFDPAPSAHPRHRRRRRPPRQRP